MGGYSVKDKINKWIYENLVIIFLLLFLRQQVQLNLKMMLILKK